ncbi:phosphotransferase [Parasulfitobacter algicola]|uniref:Phosphotransferase n=1 Tax=Parasulfitobacter algicola TaxID=2614809 RepID=A0ABX2ITU1_9RHOB|nr:phosphotransferase [Sulfitobacter algicola]NSX53593.1 phosphotransferase [Sulfitobacter algicola]
MLTRDKKVDGALEAWRIMAPKEGFDPYAYTPVRTWRKQDRRRDHIVLQLKDQTGKSIILKKLYRPTDQDAFVNTVKNHHRAHNALRDHETAQVPSILFQDDQQLVYITEFVQGTTFFGVCEQIEDRTAILAKAGAWMSAFHQATEEQRRIYQPKFMVNHINHLVDEMQSGKRRIRAQQQFIKTATYIQDFAKNFEGQESIISAKHGDMNMRNLLIGSDMSWGIDFGEISNAPVGFDIARFLLNYAETFADLDDIAPGDVIPKCDLDAFFTGYTFVGQNDPAVQFLLKVQLLLDWNRLPRNLTQTSIAHMVRFKRIQKIAKTAFV